MPYVEIVFDPKTWRINEYQKSEEKKLFEAIKMRI